MAPSTWSDSADAADLSADASSWTCESPKSDEVDAGSSDQYSQDGGTSEQYPHEYSQDGATSDQYSQEYSPDGTTSDQYSQEYSQDGATSDQYSQDGSGNDVYPQMCPVVPTNFCEIPVMMPSGEVIMMVPSQSSSWMQPVEEATQQCVDYQQGYQGCCMWMGPMQGYSMPYEVPASAGDESGCATEAESEKKTTSQKNDVEKLSLESLLPPPSEPVGEQLREAPSTTTSLDLESMLFDSNGAPLTTARDGGLKSSMSPKGLPSGTTGSMKEQLRALRMVNPAAVFIVRGIKPLGTPVVQQLQQYFSQFGEVQSVYAPHSRVKLNKLPTYQRAPVSRWRVANTGFVVMSQPEDVAKVLEQGQEHNICGVMVSVHEFHRHNSVDPEGDEVAAEESTSASSNHDSGNEGSVDTTGYVTPPTAVSGAYDYVTAPAEAVIGEEAANLCNFFYTLSVEELLSAMPEQYEE